MKKRSFDHIINNLEESIMNVDWFVDFNKVIKQVDKFTNELSLLEPLLDSNDIINDLKKIILKNKEVVKIIPALIGYRENKVKLIDRKNINFNKYDVAEKDVKKFVKFLNDTGFFEIIKNKKIFSLQSYMVGVEVGLNTHARKNRTGDLMENLIESYLKNFNILYYKKMTYSKIAKTYNLKINKVNEKEKNFDFVFEKRNKIYLVETNFYASKSGGSKINAEVTRFIFEEKEIKKVFANYKNIEFMWITDGKGLLRAKNDFKRAYKNIKNIFTIYDLKNNLFK